MVGLGWVGLGWVGLGWVRLGWVRLGLVGSFGWVVALVGGLVHRSVSWQVDWLTV